MANLPLSFFAFFSFLCQAHRSHCASDLDQCGLKTRRSMQVRLFGGLEVKPPKTKILGV